MAKITSYFTPRMSLEGDSAGGDNELPQENDLLRNNELAGVDSDCDNERPLDSDNELLADNSHGEGGSEVSGSNVAKKRRLDKHSIGFDSSWVQRWDWLRPVYGSSDAVVGLLCHLCQKHKTTARNGSTKWSTEPCMYMRIDSIQHHAKSHQHAESVTKEHALLLSGDIGCILSSETRKQITRNREAVVGALRSLYFLVKHSLPHTTLFGPFLDFCILQGCEYLANLRSADNAHYRSERVIQEFLDELGAKRFGTMLSPLLDSPYIALMADETTDIGVTKELILYARYIVPTATPEHCVRSIFLRVCELSDGKADTITTSILELLTKLDISINRVMGFGSDGASVMVGRRAGVATRLKERNPQMVAIHCVAHRLALAVAQAGDGVPYIKKFKILLHNLFSFYDNSPVRTAGLRAIQEILDNPSLKLKQAKDHQWLSHENACQSLRRTLPSVFTSLQREASERGEPMADGLYRQMANYNCMATLFLLCDVLPYVCFLSRLFQKESIDLAEIGKAVNTTLCLLRPYQSGCNPNGHLVTLDKQLDTVDGALKDYVSPPSPFDKERFERDIQGPFITKLCKNIEQRFPDVELLEAFTLFDPSKLPRSFEEATECS